VLTLGGGGLGMVWGETTFEECGATVHDAVAARINLIDLAPRYGDGTAEKVVGAAFAGRLPDGVRVTSKCNLGNAPRAEIEHLLRRSIEGSLERLRLPRLDVFFLHSNVVPDERHIARWPNASRMVLYGVFVDVVRPVLDRLVSEGLIGAWGLTGIGHPDTIIRLFGERPAPAAVQCIANLLDWPGGLKFFDGPAKPREVMAAARANGVGVMGIIRAVQAAALTSGSIGPCRRPTPRCATMPAPPASATLPPSLDRLCRRIAMPCGCPLIRWFWASRTAPNSPNASPPPKPARCRPTSSLASTDRSTVRSRNVMRGDRDPGWVTGTALTGESA
jgi:aryl-alcohol dehydrogenase-like predicted oxidoreductase